jgi:hypothetical protein
MTTKSNLFFACRVLATKPDRRDYVILRRLNASAPRDTCSTIPRAPISENPILAEAIAEVRHGSLRADNVAGIRGDSLVAPRPAPPQESA